jgi:uncharacterized protein (TIRG00374 family)
VDDEAPDGARVDEPDGGQEDERGGRSPLASVRRWLPVAIAVVVGGYAVALVVVGGEDARDAIARADVVPLLGAVLLQVVVTLTWPLVHRASVRAVGEDVSYGQALHVSMAAFTVSHTVPGGGTVGAAVAVERLTRFGVPGAAATGSVALTGPISLTTIAALGAVGIVTAFVADELPLGAVLLAGAALVALVTIVGGILAGLRSPALGERVIDRVARMSQRAARRSDGWRASWRTVTEQAPSPAGTARIVGWALVKWTADIGSLALVFVALGAEPRITLLLVGFGVSQLLAAIPATPGAVGFVEGGLIGAFVVLGLDAGTATTIAITYRVLETWMPTLAGVPILLSDVGDADGVVDEGASAG